MMLGDGGLNILKKTKNSGRFESKNVSGVGFQMFLGMQIHTMGIERRNITYRQLAINNTYYKKIKKKKKKVWDIKEIVPIHYSVYT